MFCGQKNGVTTREQHRGKGRVLCGIAMALLLLGVMSFPGCRGLQPANNGGGGTGATTASPVKHLVVIVMQNHSFDNLFGTFPGANGFTPSSPGYSQADASGNLVTPHLLTNTNPADLNHGWTTYHNEWNNGAMDGFAKTDGADAMGYYDNTTPGFAPLYDWASRFALADNYFDPVMRDAPADVLYMIAADDNGQPQSIKPAFGPCTATSGTAQPYTFTNVGDQLTDKNVPWGWFQEQYGNCGNYVPQENPFQFFTSTQNSTHISDLDLFRQELASGNLRPVSFVQPAPGHTMHPGSGDQAVAVQWLDQFLQTLQNSSSWPDMAVIVIWDEPGGWYDHVPPQQIDSQGRGFRVPMIVISPFAKTGYISHVAIDHVSIVRFIQWNWGLANLNSRNQQGGSTVELRDMFNF